MWEGAGAKSSYVDEIKNATVMCTAFGSGLSVIKQKCLRDDTVALIIPKTDDRLESYGAGTAAASNKHCDRISVGTFHTDTKLESQLEQSYTITVMPTKPLSVSIAKAAAAAQYVEPVVPVVRAPVVRAPAGTSTFSTTIVLERQRIKGLVGVHRPAGACGTYMGDPDCNIQAQSACIVLGITHH